MQADDDPTQGETGETGAKGDQGKTGKTGGPGGQGERGRTGDPGRVGDTGKTGDTGASGGHGAEGRAGDPGPKGKTGAEGPPGDPGPKGPDGGTARQKLVIEETLKQVSKRSDRRLMLKAAMGGFFAALLIMVPATFFIGLELASVSDLERIAATNSRLIAQVCNTSRRHAEIEEQAAIDEAAQNRALIKAGATFGLTQKQLADTIRKSREREALRIARLRALADTDCAREVKTPSEPEQKGK